MAEQGVPEIHRDAAAPPVADTEKTSYYPVSFNMGYSTAISDQGSSNSSAAKAKNPFLVKLFNPAHHVSTAIQTEDKWELPLTDEEECMRIMELGLGRAVDSTEKHTWETKSEFQAKGATPDSLMVIQECNKLKKFNEYVENYSNVQVGMGTTFQPIPHKPIDVSVAADTERSSHHVQAISGETVLTRTVAFKTKDPCCEEKEDFEVNLNKWLIDKNYIKCSNCDNYQNGSHATFVQKCNKCSDGEAYYTVETSDGCIEYLQILGGVTDYIMSVTLGATKYRTASKSAHSMFGKASASVGMYRFARGRASASASRFSQVMRSKTDRIGRVPKSDLFGNCNDLVRMRTMDEAVVSYSFAPLSKLIKHSYLEKQVHTAIKVYEDAQLYGTRGPFHISTAEEQFQPFSEPAALEQSGSIQQVERAPTQQRATTPAERKKMYWMMKELITPGMYGAPTKSTFVVTLTPNASEASNFYIKLDTSGKKNRKYFFIATDPQDKRHREPPTMKVPQRFLHSKGPDLKAFSFVKSDIARFKLVDRVNLTSLPVFHSKWVPDKALGSQPYVLSPRLRLLERVKSLTSTKALTVKFSHQRNRFTLRKLKRKKKHDLVVAQLFQLEPGHKCYDDDAVPLN